MYEWLSGIVGEDAARIAGFVALFLLVLLAIVVVLGLIRRLTGGTFIAGGRGRAPRLSVMDAAAVDSRRRLVLVRRDDVEHLILIGGPTDIVVEQNIRPGTSANDRLQTANLEQEPRTERAAAPVSPVVEMREAEPAVAIEPAPAAPASNPAPAARQQAPASVTPFPEKPQERMQERAPERPRPAVAAVRPAAVQPPVVQPIARPVQAPAAPRPAPQFNQPPRPAPVPPQPRPAAPQSATRAHPAYPLSQVAQGVVSATSGAAIGAGAASLNIAPSREAAQAQPETAKAAPSFPDIDISDERPSARAQPASVTPFPSASSPREDISGKLDTFNEDLHDALLNELTIDDMEPVENDTPSSELNIFPGGNEPEEETMSQLEDEMEKLLGELSRTKGN